MKKLILLFLFLTWNLLMSPSYSENKNTFTMLSFEDASCASWIQSAKDPKIRQVYIHWFRGFISGYNYGDEKYSVNSVPNDAATVLHIDKFCRETPLLPFTSASVPFVKELRTKN